CQQYDSLPFSF
nr:immunoglobulin light chain junction region [Macaca mulatta]MOX50272.1 immunoglobulin light chain junction region [Macaca mulatta]